MGFGKATIAALAIAAGFATAATPVAPEHGAATVQLRGGAAIQGQLLSHKPDRLILDLSFTVLSVPMDQVLSVDLTGGLTGEQRQPTDEHGLYHGAPKRAALSVADNVERCAEAVLRVRTPVGLGSGFAIHPDGYVVTNHHVIDGEYRITLTLFEQGSDELRQVSFEQVRIVALDADLDLALLKIEDLGGHRLPTVPLGDSSTLAQGENVFSIGSPLGFDRTVSQGIISLRNRLIDGRLYLQSTVQINSGNSGGPLFNLRGQVVGVNNMKIQSVGVEGLSFAISTDVLKSFLDNIDAYAFDARNSNNGFRYTRPPSVESRVDPEDTRTTTVKENP